MSETANKCSDISRCVGYDMSEEPLTAADEVSRGVGWQRGRHQPTCREMFGDEITHEEASDSFQGNVTLVFLKYICIDDKYCTLGFSIRRVQFGIH